jgi:KDO2-lipid IV(A) lauroyltransferase
MLLVKLLARLPFWFWYGLSDFSFVLVYYIIGYRKQVVAANLKLAFPEMNEQARKTVIKGFYKNLMDIVVETIKSFALSKEEVKQRAKIVNPELFEHYKQRYRGVILMASHHTNWEYMHLGVTAEYDFPLLGVYKKLNNKKVDILMTESRTKFGATAVEIQDTLKVIRQTNEFFAVGLIADQSPQPRKKNLQMEFFGRTVPFYPGPVHIARLFEMPVFFVHIKRVRRGYYELELEFIAEPPFDNPAAEIMGKYIQLLEDDIRKQPENYLWSHKRWKHAEPFENEVETA